MLGLSRLNGIDDIFNCPECGTAVAITGLAPGRQVRCGFCDRLLEIPYLPRVLKTDWRRRRFGRPRWVAWAWGAIGLAVVVVLTASIVRFLERRERANLERSIADLVTASEIAQSDGDLSKALIDLDAAIHLQAGSRDAEADRLQDLKQRRLELNQREAGASLDRLKHRDEAAFPIGDWLNLQARVDADKQLKALVPVVRKALRQSLGQRIDALIQQAEKASGSDNWAEAIQACESSSTLVSHLPAADQPAIRKRLETIVDGLIGSRGILVDATRTQQLATQGSRASPLKLPFIDRALTSKGYLPQPDSSAWRDHWTKSPYRIKLELSERFEGTYLGSQNRLTRVEGRIVLMWHDQPFWETRPVAKAPVPLPNLSAYASGHLALHSQRSEEFEKLLRDRANSMIDDKLIFALRNMPACGQAPR